jgi:hypothetical protein
MQNRKIPSLPVLISASNARPIHSGSKAWNRSLFESSRISEATNMVYTGRSRTFASGLALTVEISRLWINPERMMIRMHIV